MRKSDLARSCLAVLPAALSVVGTGTSVAQQTAEIGFGSTGRGAPLAEIVPAQPTTPAELQAVAESVLVGPMRLRLPGPDGAVIDRLVGAYTVKWTFFADRGSFSERAAIDAWLPFGKSAE